MTITQCTEEFLGIHLCIGVISHNFIPMLGIHLCDGVISHGYYGKNRFIDGRVWFRSSLFLNPENRVSEVVYFLEPVPENRVSTFFSFSFVETKSLLFVSQCDTSRYFYTYWVTCIIVVVHVWRYQLPTSGIFFSRDSRGGVPVCPNRNQTQRSMRGEESFGFFESGHDNDLKSR